MVHIEYFLSEILGFENSVVTPSLMSTLRYTAIFSMDFETKTLRSLIMEVRVEPINPIVCRMETSTPFFQSLIIHKYLEKY